MIRPWTSTLQYLFTILEIALKAIEIEKLDKVYFVPMGDYYKKEGLLPAEERYNMLKIMVEEYPKLDVSRILNYKLFMLFLENRSLAI